MARYGKNIINSMEEIISILTSTYNYESSNECEALYKTLNDVLHAMNEATNMTITDSDGTILYVNDQFCQLTKYKKEEIVGQNIRIFNSGYHANNYFEQMWETLKWGSTWRDEVQIKAKDGSVSWISAIYVPLKDDNNQPYQFICFQTDITEKKQKETQFKTNFIRTFHNLQNGIFKVRKEQDGTLKYTMSEGRLMDVIGASAQFVLDKSPLDLFEPDIAKLKQKMYLKAFEGTKVQYEIELSGRLIYVDVEPIQQNGVVTEIVGTVYDFSEFRDVQKQLKVNEERYQSLINNSHEYITTFDKEGIIVHMTPKTMQLFGLDENIFGKLNVIDVTVEEKREIIAEYFNKAMGGEVQFFEFEVENNGQVTYLNINLVPIIIDNVIEGIYAIGKDITDEKLVQKRNAYLAIHDELTGLLNRRGMEQLIQESLKLARDNQQNMAILSLDLDRFKSINDTLGHFIGDELLQQIASRLQNNIYKDKMHVARMGGDEFMILCPKLETNEEVTVIAQNILDCLKKPYYIQDFELLITTSIGIVLYPSTDDNVTNLMKRVDIALYKSKELGRNMYQIYDRSMDRENFKSFVMERDLRKAIMNDEFSAHFQPKVDALIGKTIGAEALIRWNHPKHGNIPPCEFIPLAEETGLIHSIGAWMVKKVCEQLVTWRSMGYTLIPISVNISSKRFLQQGFAEDMRRLLKKFNLEGHWLEIEITENSIMRNEEIVQKTMKELKEMGVKIYIDDFGTGYSSFNYLKTFELDGVKIDRSFIRNIHTNPESASITSAMIKVAQLFNLDIIAEGVETKEELDYLLNKNCRYIQGYYFGKPCPIEEFEKKYLQKSSEMEIYS